MIPIFTGIVENGKLKLSDIDKFNSYLLSLRGGVEITIKKHRDQRSLEQNKYYWGVVIKLLTEEMGLSEDETHEILKYQFLKIHIDIQLKDRIEGAFYVRSTTSLNTKEMEEYLEKIRTWASQELNCSIPLPNEVDF
jgi:hypothetical protein